MLYTIFDHINSISKAAGADIEPQTGRSVLVLVLSESGSPGEHFLGGCGRARRHKVSQAGHYEMYTIFGAKRSKIRLEIKDPIIFIIGIGYNLTIS